MTCQWPLSTLSDKFSSGPSASSLVYWFMRPNICGKNAAMVSDLIWGAVWLVTSKPSESASNAPATPGNFATFATISFADKRFAAGPMISSKETPFCAGKGVGAGEGPAISGATTGTGDAGAGFGNGVTKGAAICIGVVGETTGAAGRGVGMGVGTGEAETGSTAAVGTTDGCGACGTCAGIPSLLTLSNKSGIAVSTVTRFCMDPR